MKKFLLINLLIIFIAVILPIKQTFCFDNININEKIELIYNNSIYSYSLNDNIKHSNQFDLDEQINRYERFSNKENRQKLLKKMLSCGFNEEIAVNYLFPNINKKVNKISNSIFQKEENAKLEINSNNSEVFKITKEKIGIKVDEIKLYRNICEKYLSNKQLIFNIPTITTLPEITSSFYESFSNLRSSFSTDASSSSVDRKHNIKTALNTLNKVEILPNQVFSFNKTIGKRTQENGYRQAKIIVNNEYVEGFGGGVCQVSTTLYNAALLAGLEIVEANKHSKQISYVKAGFDAMVNFGSSDLKIKNNLTEKITIITNFNNGKIKIRIYGEKLGDYSYKLTNNISNVIEPIEEVYVDENNEYADKVIYNDEYFYLKHGNRGLDIDTFRETYCNGVLIKTEKLRHDKYEKQNSIKIYGTKKRTATETENIVQNCCA